VDLTNLAPESAWFAQEALAVWSAVSGIRFSTAAPPAGTPVGLRFFDDNSGAYSSATVLDGFTANVLINVSRAWIAGDHYSHESYALQSYIHEIGHALGLGHPGAYDLGDGVTITWADHAEFANDSWQSSVMSYFNQSENARIDATRAYLLTPMPADILAVQMLYGRAGTLRTGDTVYGEGSTAGDYYDTLAGRWHKMAFALIDDGGRDTLRVDTTAADQRIRLAPESFSDLGGATGNMTIARGTVIENAISGTGDDRIEGNDAANRLAGGAGDDTIWGAIGGDTLVGGLGHDRLAGDLGPDRLAGRDGNDVLDGGDGTDRLRGGRGIDWITGGPGTDRMRGGADNDTFVFRRGDGADVIADWQAGGDRLDLRTWGLDGIAELTLRAVAEGLLVEFGPGDSVLLAGAVAGDLPVEDILFS
jgi:serralysin